MWSSCQTSKEPSSPMPYNSTLHNQAVEAFVATDLEQTNVNNGKAVYPICPQIHSALSSPQKSVLRKKTKMQDLSCKINRSYHKFLAYIELPPSIHYSCRIGITWLFHLVKPQVTCCRTWKSTAFLKRHNYWQNIAVKYQFNINLCKFTIRQWWKFKYTEPQQVFSCIFPKLELQDQAPSADKTQSYLWENKKKKSKHHMNVMSFATQGS